MIIDSIKCEVVIDNSPPKQKPLYAGSLLGADFWYKTTATNSFSTTWIKEEAAILSNQHMKNINHYSGKQWIQWSPILEAASAPGTVVKAIKK